MRDYGLTYGFGIIAVVEGSPAMRAGARVGDEIVGINGQDLSRFAKEAVKRKASYDRVEAFEDFLQIALLERDIILRVKRAGQYLDLPLESERGCGGRFTNLRTKRLNAWSNGKYVTVSTSMMQFAEDDGELAFIMAHEMAHNILAHNGAERSEVGLLPDRSTKAGGRQAREFQADVFAIEIIRDAGYDPYCVPLLFARIGKRTSQAFALSHPNIKRRMAAVAIEIRESSKRRHFVTQINRPEGVEVREADPLAFQTRIRDEILNEDKRYYSDASFNLPSLSRWASSSGTVGLTSLSRDRRGPSFDSKMDTSKNRWISARW